MRRVRADTDRVLTRLRDAEGGIGLIELLIALTMLNIGLLALVASLNSGMATLNHASRVSTASLLAERRLELYRGVGATAVGLHEASVTARYTGETVYGCDPAVMDPALTCSAASRTAQVYLATCTATVERCMPTRVVTGPDGQRYRVDTYVVATTPAATGPVRPVKLVTVVVRDAGDLERMYARHQSTFDEGT